MAGDAIRKRAGAAPESKGDVVRYHTRFALLQAVVFLAVVGAFLSLILRQIQQQEENDLGMLSQRFGQYIHNVEGNFEHLQMEVTVLKYSAEKNLRESRGGAVMHPLFRFLKSTPDHEAFHLDEVDPPFRKANYGNLTGEGSLEGRSPEFLREVSMALDLGSAFSRLAWVMPRLTWIYYYSKDNFAVYFPWFRSTETRFQKAAFKTTAWTLGLPENNPDRKPYWTEAYFDAVGKGLMTSCLAPLYDEDRFLGVIGADMSVDFLNKIAAGFEPSRGGTMVFYDQFGSLLAAPGRIAATDKQIKKLPSALPKALINALNRLAMIPAGAVERLDGWRVARADLSKTTYKVLYFEREPSRAEALLGQASHGAYPLLGGLAALLLVSMIVTHMVFVRPSARFVQHILAKSKGGESIWAHGIPQAWHPWFRTIDRVFDDNAALTGQLETRNRDLLTEVSERKRAEEENAKFQSELTQAQKMESVGRLAGGVAHDFNNMLGVILGHAEMALEQVGLAEPVRGDLEEIQKAAQRSADLTRQLLAFARKQTVSPKVLDLNETVDGMLKMLRRLIGEDIDLVWRPATGLGQVKIDPSQIDQILANLAVNARDAISGVGQVTIETANVELDEAGCAERGEMTPGKYAMLALSDNGCGMDKETQAHIFEPFFTTKGVGAGTGLGLAMVFGIVRQNNGFITVCSKQGEGTTFKIYLPRYAGKSALASAEGLAEPAKGGGETILVVEDEPAILSLSKSVLEKLGYTVLAASRPGEAIRLAEDHAGRIDLLMTDVVMPEMNGRDLAKRLLSHYPGLKRLFMSGYTADVIAHHGVLDEGVHFIQKPFSREALATKVREALGDEFRNSSSGQTAGSSEAPRPSARTHGQ